ncbi:MAG: glycoside hydrolase family 3 N-terminal domain-containing protein [Pseudomonadota bacterium]
MPKPLSPQLQKFARLALIGLVLLMLLAAAIFSFNAFSTWQLRQKVMATPAAQAQLLGSRFIVGYEDAGEVTELARRGLIAGVFVTARNAKNKSAEVLQREIAQMQAVRRSAGLPALMVATDQEGGDVSRLSPPLARQPALSSLVAGATLSGLQAQAFDYGVVQGQALASLGVNINFSPVVDIKSGRALSPLDLFSRINNRAISGDPEMVSSVAAAYSRGLASAGVLATLKHFPGLGEVAADTHLFSAQLNTPVATLQHRDWLPFRRVLAQSDALMMLGHVSLPELDSVYPASLSHKVVQGVIRKDWGHDGVLVSDDLTMRAAQLYGTCGATLAALNAGVDLLLLAYDHGQFYEAMQCALDALNAGQLDSTLMTGSQQRLVRFKQRFSQRQAAAKVLQSPLFQAH